jgi:hypothetical protein
MSYRLNTRLRAFTAQSTTAIGEALLVALSRRLSIELEDVGDRPRVAQRVATTLKNLADNRLQGRFREEMRRLAEAALTPRLRPELAEEAKTRLEDRAAVRRLEKLLDALDRKKLQPDTVHVMAWYRSKGYSSYRAYREGNKAKDLARTTQRITQLRVLAGYGDGTASEALGRIAKQQGLDLKPYTTRPWGYESGKFAKAVGKASFSLSRLELRERLNRHGALASAEASYASLASRIAVGLKGVSPNLLATKAPEALRAVAPELNYSLSLAVDFNLPAKEEGPLHNYFRAGFVNTNFPATNPELAAMALIRALKGRRG